MGKISIEFMQELLLKSWSIESSSKWTRVNPACGQCGVTSLVVQNFLGGAILKTPLGNSWHFYNLIEGKRIDFTKSQFEYELEYQDFPSSREEAFADTNQTQYNYLKSEVEYLLKI
jgi:hypothetical protein